MRSKIVFKSLIVDLIIIVGFSITFSVMFQRGSPGYRMSASDTTFITILITAIVGVVSSKIASIRAKIEVEKMKNRLSELEDENKIARAQYLAMVKREVSE